MTIEERLENMEREVGRQKRRNRWLLGAILVLLGGLVAAGVFKTMIPPVQAQVAGTAKQIRVRSIEIEDEKGALRAALGVSKDVLGLLLMDENGKVRAVLGVEKDVPVLRLWDEKGAFRAALGVAKDGPRLSLYDANSKPRAVLGVEKDGPGLLLMFGPDGKVIWSAIK